MNVLARERHIVVSLAVSLAASLTLAACGLFGDKEEKGDLSPAPSMAPSATPVDTAAPLPLPTATPAGPAAPGQTPASPVVGVKADAGAPADAGVPTDAGKADAAAPSDAGASSTKLKGCSDKCQAAMQSCLTPEFPKDGGFPKIKDPVACQAAAEACRAACAP